MQWPGNSPMGIVSIMNVSTLQQVGTSGGNIYSTIALDGYQIRTKPNTDTLFYNNSGTNIIVDIINAQTPHITRNYEVPAGVEISLSSLFGTMPWGSSNILIY